MTANRKWSVRAAGVAVAIVAAAGTWVGLNATELRAKFAARKLVAAATDEERAKWADTLVGYDEPGVRKLAECLQTGDDHTRRAAGAAVEKHLTTLPDGDARAVAASVIVLDAYAAATGPGKLAVLRLVPATLKHVGSAHAVRCREVVSAALKLTDVEARLAAVRLAMHPDIRLRAEVAPLLAAPEPEVRGAALLAVATATDGEAGIADEELFRWLHDADAGVRKVCRDILVARDRSETEIAHGARLTHADPAERLKLLLDLRYDDLADPEPWLVRLSRDPEPAVRAGAARVAAEVSAARNLPNPTWVARVAESDAHPTVRFVAAFYSERVSGAPDRPVRPASGP